MTKNYGTDEHPCSVPPPSSPDYRTSNPMIDDFDRKLKGLIFSLREMADDFNLSPHGRGRAHRIREAIELLDSFNVMHQERDRLQMRLKRHEPVSHYNGRDIDWWKARAEQAWAALRHLLSHADRPRKELLWCTSAVEEADRALSGDSPCADETFGKEPWRVALPVITDEMREQFGGDLRLIDNNRQWTQDAVDFACMLQGEWQSALKASASTCCGDATRGCQV